MDLNRNRGASIDSRHVNHFLQYAAKLFRKLLIVYLFFALTRLLFLIANYSFFDQFTWIELASAFYYGLLFDTAAIIYFNSPFLLLYFFPTPYRTHPSCQKSLDSLLIIGTMVALALNLIDVSYFAISKQRSGMELINMKQDLLYVMPAFLTDYWFLFVFFLLFLYVFITLNTRWAGRFTHGPENWTWRGYTFNTVVFFIWICLLTIGARGGFYHKPIRTMDATRFVHPKLTPVVTNTPMQLISTIAGSSIPNYKYFPDSVKKQYIQPVKEYDNESEGPQQNVVIIILESVAKEYIGYVNKGDGYTPFFDSLCHKGLAFEHSYANGLHSIDALPAILSGIPALMSTPYLNSNFQTNKINSMGKLLRQEMDYSTSFYHGGQNGTMSFDNYIRLSRHGKYYGLEQYPYPNKHWDGNWGIYDEPYMQYFARQLQQEEKPFCATLFTLSSHHPYSVQPRYEDTLPKGDIPIHKSIAYADLSLRKFFDTASGMDWYENTLFIITADHTSENSPKKKLYQTSYNKFAVPIVLYNHRMEKLPSPKRTVQHIDILPTVLDYLGYPQPFYALGNSVFDTTRNGYAVQRHYTYYQMIDHPWLLGYDSRKVRYFHNIQKDPMLTQTLDTAKAEKREYLRNKLKAVLQEYSTKLHKNKLYYEY